MKKLSVLFSLVMLFTLLTGCGMKIEKDTDNPNSTSQANFGEKDYKEIVPTNNELGFKLIKKVETDKKDNTFISPISLVMALSMIYNGADGVTKEEIAKTLDVNGIDVKALNKANASFMSIMNKDSNSVQLDVTNAIWLNEDFQFQDEFSQQNKDYFHAETKEIDINDATSPKKINDWISEATNGKIKDIVTDPLSPDLVAILINAIYFQGDWTYAFDQRETEDAAFHFADKSKKDVPFMKLTEDLSYLENDDFQAVSLPYGEGEMSMKVFLPKENNSLKDFKKTLTNQTWKVWNSEFQMEKGTVLLPKFQIEYEVSLNETLQQLGMESAFGKDADFDKMVLENDPVWISQVKQKTFIDVNEEGTEADAATSAEMETVSAPVDEDDPFKVNVNRPFFIMIVDEETEAILFMGSINNP